MASVPFVGFKGIMSELSPKLLGDGYSVVCTNCFLDNGAVTGFHGLTEVATLGKTGTINTLHLLNNITWLHWNEVVSAVLAPIANNDEHYTIFTGTDKPRYTDNNKALGGGGTSYPVDSFWLGFPAPALVVNAAVGGGAVTGLRLQWTIAGTETDTIGNKLTYSYIYTFVNQDGREGPPSDASDAVFASTDDVITLTNFSALTGTYDPVSPKIRIYRSENGSPFQFLVELPDPPVGGQFIDSFTITAGTAIETTLWDAPPNGMKGAVVMSNGIVAGFVQNDLYLSQPYQPHAWPEDFVQHVDYPIVGLAAAGNTLIITTEKYGYIMVGTHPDFMTLNKMETQAGNLNIRSLVDIGNNAVYASQDGLMIVGQEGSRILSKDIISENTWTEMNPSSIHGHYYRGNYIGFYNAGSGTINTGNGETIPAHGSFIFDIERGYVSYLDVTATAAYSDLGTASLFIVQDVAGVNKVFEFNDDTANPLLYTYKSAPITLTETTLTAARIELKGTGKVDFELWVDGGKKYSKTVRNKNVFRMPSGYKGREFQIQLKGTTDANTQVDGVFLATDVSSVP